MQCSEGNNFQRGKHASQLKPTCPSVRSDLVLKCISLRPRHPSFGDDCSSGADNRLPFDRERRNKTKIRTDGGPSHRTEVLREKGSTTAVARRPVRLGMPHRHATIESWRRFREPSETSFQRPTASLSRPWRPRACTTRLRFTSSSSRRSDDDAAGIFGACWSPTRGFCSTRVGAWVDISNHIRRRYQGHLRILGGT